MHFADSDDKQKLNKVIEQFQTTFIGETNETYERFIFNSRDQKEGETIEQYITVLRTLAQSCNFCTCLKETLLRDRVVLGVKDNSVRKKLLQERKLTLAKALDICRSSETTSKQLRNMISLNEKSIDNEIKAIREQWQGNRRGDPSRSREKKRCKYSIAGECMNLIRIPVQHMESRVRTVVFAIISQGFARRNGMKLHDRSRRLPKMFLVTLVIQCTQFPFCPSFRMIKKF